MAGALVALDTVSARSNVAAAELLADRLDSGGFRTALQRWEADGVAKANVVAVAGPPVEGGLLVSGHVDTVPFEGQPGWSRDPLRLEIGDERVFGRGTSDMKVFLAHCLDAARRLDAGRLRRPVAFAFTADEEVGCLGAGRLAPELAALLEPVPPPRLAWIGEPTSFEVFHAHQGIAVLEVRVRGRGGHSGLPALGVNAIEVMGRVMEALARLQRELAAAADAEAAALFPDAPRTTINLGTIRGGTAENVIAEECSLVLSVRSLPGEDPAGLCREIERRLEAVECGDGGGGPHRAAVDVRRRVVLPPLCSRRGTALEGALFAVLGRRPSRGALFVADGCRFARAGIDSLLCGPGDFAEAHQPNESIPRAAFERGTDVVLSVVRHVCG